MVSQLMVHFDYEGSTILKESDEFKL